MSNNNDLEILEKLVINNPTNIIRWFENHLRQQTKNEVISILKERAREGNDVNRILPSALRIKKIVGQINTIVHAYGILVALPYILEDNERVEQLSLGAGNTGRKFDLETNLRVTEFKFAEWGEGPNALRKKHYLKIFSI